MYDAVIWDPDTEAYGLVAREPKLAFEIAQKTMVDTQVAYAHGMQSRNSLTHAIRVYEKVRELLKARTIERAKGGGV